MSGSATFTMVASSTTISWLIRITASTSEPRFIRHRRGRASRPTMASKSAASASPGRACNVAEDIGSNSTSQSTIRNGSFLQLLYGGSLRIASEYCGRSSHDLDRNNREMASKQTTVAEQPAEAERPMRADARRNYQRLLEAGR